jgi:hypothetical protein
MTTYLDAFRSDNTLSIIEVDQQHMGGRLRARALLLRHDVVIRLYGVVDILHLSISAFY